ncbi:MAG: hypothetical protein ABW195_17765 [Ilumatobacteraceae bacterium]
MQPFVTPFRVPASVSVTDAAVENVIRRAEGVQFGAGCELLAGLSLVVADDGDVSAALASGSITRGSYNRLHATASLVFDQPLPWASAIVRPFITMSDGTTTFRFNLGAYYTSSPQENLDEQPTKYAVTCYDILSVLDDPVGDAYSVAEGTPYLEAIESILMSRGIVRYMIDQSAAGLTLTSDKAWEPSDQLTWLTIVNDLLAAIGYAGIWSDWDGVLRCHSYQSPRERAPEWTYDVEPGTSMLGTRTKLRDFYKVPNVWIFTKRNDTDGPQPVEGDGRYTYINQSDGDTSIDGRGRTITRPVQVDAADQASLVAAATRIIDADLSIPSKVDLTTFPNPLHWHFDVVQLIDPAVGPPTPVLVTAWTLPLNGDDMRHEWTLLDRLGAD